MEERGSKMNKKSSKNKQENTNVEFGMEFGDVNASKFYDVAALANNKGKKSVEKKN
jgi:hypothetical protein